MERIAVMTNSPSVQYLHSVHDRTNTLSSLLLLSSIPQLLANLDSHSLLNAPVPTTLPA
jgi:hypothetical protein